MGLKRRFARSTHRLQLLTEQPRVMISTPAQDSCLSNYVRSLVKCVAQSIADGLIVGYQVAQYSMIPHSRNVLCQQAIAGGWTHVLFIDSDMEFPPDLVSRLLSHKQPIVAANCMARRSPYYLTARSDTGHEILTLQDSTGLQAAARVGTGVMLVHLDALRAMPMPWFEYGWNAETQGPIGEDFLFCDKLRAQGVPIYVDHDVSKQVAHVGTFQYHPLIRAGFREVETLTRHAEQQQSEGVASNG